MGRWEREVEKSEKKDTRRKVKFDYHGVIFLEEKYFIISLKIHNSGRTLLCAKGPKFPHQYHTHTHTPRTLTTNSRFFVGKGQHY